MTRVSTKQRMISAQDLESPGYLRCPDEAKPTALGLWLHTDIDGRRELVPELIAAALYPGRAATELIVEHLLMLDEAGFLTIYTTPDGREWVALARPLKADRRGAISDCPPPPHGASRRSVAVGGARERAEARVLAEGVERAGVWDVWAEEQERAHRPPARPLLLDAPPIGCPDHPHGAFEDCGPCGTARRRHDRWVAQQRYTDQLAKHDNGEPADDEPF